MAFLKSLPRHANVRDVYRRFEAQYRPWREMWDTVMEGESAITRAEREMIAVYVSALNTCAYCRDGHTTVMEKLGIDAQVVDEILDDIETASVRDSIKPLLRYCRKLAVEPAAVTQRDAEAVFAAGWDEEAFHRAVLIVCRFSFMNRLTLGLGLTPMSAKQASDFSDACVAYALRSH